jgi:hypothetical protein
MFVFGVQIGRQSDFGQEGGRHGWGGGAHLHYSGKRLEAGTKEEAIEEKIEGEECVTKKA